jgi:MFS family permease
VLLPIHTRDELGGPVDLGLLEPCSQSARSRGDWATGRRATTSGASRVFTVAFLIVGMHRFAVPAFADTFAPLAVMAAIEGLACGVLNPILAGDIYETVPEVLRSRVVSATTASVLTIGPTGRPRRPGLEADGRSATSRGCQHLAGGWAFWWCVAACCCRDWRKGHRRGGVVTSDIDSGRFRTLIAVLLLAQMMALHQRLNDPACHGGVHDGVRRCHRRCPVR